MQTDTTLPCVLLIIMMQLAGASNNPGFSLKVSQHQTMRYVSQTCNTCTMKLHRSLVTCLMIMLYILYSVGTDTYQNSQNKLCCCEVAQRWSQERFSGTFYKKVQDLKFICRLYSKRCTSIQ